MADTLSLGTLSTSGNTTRLTGTSSGIDTGKLVDALVEAKRLPAVRLERKIDANTSKQAAYGDLRGKLETLQQVVAGLRNPPGVLGTDTNLFERKEVYFSSDTTTSPASLLAVGAANKVPPGSFEVVVDRLATARKFMSGGAVSATQSLAQSFHGGNAFAGSFELGLAGGATAAIAVDGTMSLQDVKAAINARSADTGVGASVLKVAEDDWRLVLSAKETGREVILTAGDGDDVRDVLGLWNSTSGTFENPLVAAQTAQVTIDGVAVTRPGNRIADAIDGVTLDLFKADPGTRVTVDVQRSLAGVKDQIGGFVEAYNAVQDAFDQYGALDELGQRPDGAVLYGDSYLRSLDQTLGGLVGGAVGGLGPNAISTLAGLGIRLDQDNRLQIDEAKLDERLAGDLDAVRDVFEFRFTASADTLRVLSRDNALADSAFTVSVVDADNDGVPESATADGVALEIEGNRLKGATGTAYAGLQMVWVGTGNASIDVTATQGIADRIFNQMDRVLGDGDGSLTKFVDALGEQSAGFQKEIGRIEERAQRLREQLVAKFTALEAAMATAKSLLDQVRAQLGIFGARLTERSMSHLQGRAAIAYGRAAETLPPAQQILMLYDGAARRVEEIKAAIAAGDVEARYRLTRKAGAIVDGLQACLDHERGGEIASLLERLYTYFSLRLAQVNTQNDPKICDELLARLAELRASWAVLAHDPSHATAPAIQHAPAA